MKKIKNIDLQFNTKLYKINDLIIARLPNDASIKLPSRGMVMVEGTINGNYLHTLLEPDGNGSHWFNPDTKMLKDMNLQDGNIINVKIHLTDKWIEPQLPDDLKNALSGSAKAFDLWKQITPSARWDWLRWIRAVKTPETRLKHIEVALSKLNKGIRRPCCFNRNLCTVPEVSTNNWVLINESHITN